MLADIMYTLDVLSSSHPPTLLLFRKWKDMKLMALQKAQLLDISLSTENRCIFVAKDILKSNSNGKSGK